jgi:hypothetical protein
VPSVRHELPIAGMIDGLEADDLSFEQMVLLAQEPQKLQLRSRRSDYENLVRVSQHGRNLLEEVSAVARVLVFGRGAFGVSVKMMFRRGDRFCLELFCVDAEDARLLMVEPHDCLMSDHDEPQSKRRAKFHPLHAWQ